MQQETVLELFVDDSGFAIYNVVVNEKGRIKLIFDEDGYECEIVKKKLHALENIALGTDADSELVCSRH